MAPRNSLLHTVKEGRLRTHLDYKSRGPCAPCHAIIKYSWPFFAAAVAAAAVCVCIFFPLWFFLSRLQALKQKQLDDLDALLGEFGVEGERVPLVSACYRSGGVPVPSLGAPLIPPSAPVFSQHHPEALP